MKQVILGAGGDIGTLLAKELKQYTDDIRLVSRNPIQVNGDDELWPADLLKVAQVREAVQGADIVYLVVGLKYDTRVWKRNWPLLIEHVIAACIHAGAKLVFFDNVYMYDKKAIPNMIEDSVINPPSVKGEVRSNVSQKVQQAIANRGLQALIARCADFYGPGAKNGILNTLVLDPLRDGNKPKWQSDLTKIHAFTYTVDAARATALLGNTESAYGQVWHLPTSTERLTGRQFVELACGIKGTKPACMVLGTGLMRVAGLFNRTIAELVEMQYQNTQDYYFDSRKFCDAFDFVPTTYEEGMREVLVP